jgi:hypothetical protein
VKFHYWQREVYRADTASVVFRGIGVSIGLSSWFIGVGRWTLEKPHA